MDRAAFSFARRPEIMDITSQDDLLRSGLFSPVSPRSSVAVEKLRLAYSEHTSDHHFVLWIDHLALDGGAVNCLYGTNGCGKTSLLKLLAGAIKAQEGTVSWQNPDRPRRGPDLVLVTHIGPWPHWTVWENIYHPLRENLFPEVVAQRRARKVIELLGLQGLDSRYSHQLSTGQQQRTVLARALALTPRILLLDETLNGQSEYWVRHISSILRSYAKLGGMVVIVAHESEWVASYADHVTHLVSEVGDHAAGTRFFVGYSGSTKEWEDFRRIRAQ